MSNTTQEANGTVASQARARKSRDNGFFVDRNAPTNDSVDLARVSAAVRAILAAVGEDPDRNGLLGHLSESLACTPKCLQVQKQTRVGI